MKPDSDSDLRSQWIGRFAPTPSGPLHFGSLVAAVGSYCIAKKQGGLWLLRIEDLDPPREVRGAASQILKTLEAFGFEWDEEVIYQSKRWSLYQDALATLKKSGLTYRCDCSRKLVHQRNNGIYDNYCRQRNIEALLNTERDIKAESAVRIKFHSGFESFTDQILGECRFEQAVDKQDFVILRRDGFFAYQLAVVVDDIEQKVNHVVRGADILDSTPRQNYLYHCLESPTPDYYHLPLVVDAKGNKFSKTRFSPAIKFEDASCWLMEALSHLGQNVEPELSSVAPREILRWAVDNWSTDKVGKNPQIFSALNR